MRQTSVFSTSLVRGISGSGAISSPDPLLVFLVSTKLIGEWPRSSSDFRQGKSTRPFTVLILDSL